MHAPRPPLALACLVALLASPPAGARRRQREPPGASSAYVLALSWSPSFCAAHPRGNDEQCGAGAHNGFVVHGLWPRDERGAEACKGAPLPDAVVASILDLMPSRGLVRHEWQKHGACTGLSPEAYFAQVRKAFAKVRIPDRFRAPGAPATLDAAAVERAFVEANPGLAPEMIAVSCDRTLSEVRLCLDASLGFVRCNNGGADRCRGPALVPPVR